MTLRYLLDTDVLSLLQHDPEAVGKQIHAHIVQVGADSVGTSVVNVEEQLRGRFEQIRKAEADPKGSGLCAAYARLREAVEFFRKVPVLDYTAKAHNCLTELRTKGRLTRQKVKPHDLRIGCIALAHSLVVVTRNRQDFGKIPGLTIEDWAEG